MLRGFENGITCTIFHSFLTSVWGRLNKGILVELTRLWWTGGTIRHDVITEAYRVKVKPGYSEMLLISMVCLKLSAAKNSTRKQISADTIPLRATALSQVLMLLFWCRGQWCGHSMSMIQSRFVSYWLMDLSSWVVLISCVLFCTCFSGFQPSYIHTIILLEIKIA
jgi:hypothetical protein